MTATVDWATKIISVPKADLTFISGTLYEMDTDAFRLELKGIEASVDGMAFERITKHSTTVTVAGVTYARTIEVINGYTIQFEDGVYAVRLAGSNNNMFDEGILSRNQVSVISTNSAGLVVTSGGGSGGSADEARASAGYDGSTSQIELSVWLDRNGTTVTSPTSCSVDWRNQDGTLLFNVTSSTKDAQGHFSLSKTQALVAGEAYYLVISVTDSSGTVTTGRSASLSSGAAGSPEGTGGIVFPIYGLDVT